MTTDKQALRERAESTIGILENIAGFEPSDIDGDTVELRFETDDGFDTGCDVSIVDQCQKAADVVQALLDELEAAERQRGHLREQRDKAISNFEECSEMATRIAELAARLRTKP
jgi:DNA polymerase II large subunit